MHFLPILIAFLFFSFLMLAYGEMNSETQMGRRQANWCSNVHNQHNLAVSCYLFFSDYTGPLHSTASLAARDNEHGTKNINIEDIEEAMEGPREEERVTVNLCKKQMTATFSSSMSLAMTKMIRKSIPKSLTSQTMAAKILAQRSAVPAVFSRTTSSGKRKAAVMREEKEWMLHIAKCPRKGPFNSIVDPTEFGAGSAMIGITKVVKNSGHFDPWAADEEMAPEVPEGTERLRKMPVKAPTHIQPQKIIEVPAVVEPHLGTSYNPPADAYHELLLKAHEIEEKRISDAEKLMEVKTRMEKARVDVDDGSSGVPRMKVDIATAVKEEQEPVEIFSKPAPERKTKQQRRKAAKVLAEEAKMNSTKYDAERQQHRLLAEAKLKKGLSGKKLGRHKVSEGEVGVQLGEDLGESLRVLEPEGNLFRNRFLSLQHRGRIEPHVLVLPKKQRTWTVEYEKHAWKNFDRQQ
ncbi:hypothetical protein EV421DRAFT_1733755 [Armillaria borealis]|uniref:Ribosome biogenesis protein NOP53 n=1 Tax=Armillaria borealis TaxID=47425 RepID=A0AA39MVC3_9AGAR|nr:hypothetical protein EV421DRAFT_1733755 [Armillaria borealis]